MYTTGLRSPSSILLLLTDAFAWWAAQMRGLLLGDKAAPQRLPDAEIIAVTNLAGPHPAGDLFLRRGGVETRLRPIGPAHARSPGSALPLLLRLPPGMVLTRDVSLPLAAAGDLHHRHRLRGEPADALHGGRTVLGPVRRHA